MRNCYAENLVSCSPEKIELRSKKNSGDFFRVCVGKVYMLINMGVKLPEKTYCHGN